MFERLTLPGSACDTNTFGFPGVMEHAITFWSLDDVNAVRLAFHIACGSSSLPLTCLADGSAWTLAVGSQTNTFGIPRASRSTRSPSGECGEP